MSQTPTPPTPPSNPNDPYPLDPQPQAAAPASGKGKIERPGLIEGFEEDADFTRDPELERAVVARPYPPTPPPPSAPPEGAPTGPEFVTAAWPWEPTFWAIVGAALLIGAMVAAGINVPHADGKEVASWHRVLRILLALYTALLHTGTGVAAAFVASILLHRRFGRLDIAAARMLAGVAGFLLLFNMKFTITATKFEETVFAALAYLAIVAPAFRLWKKEPFMFVIGSHFAFWLIVQVGMALSVAAAARGG
jgi:hypothetical protein